MQPMVYQQTNPRLYQSNLIRVDNPNAALFGAAPVVAVVACYIPTFRPRRR